jgi:DNA polymerase I-like protein with 3'-5' exonuclease and polymerase domains
VNTDKYPRMWAEIKERGDEHLNAPSVKAVNIEVMSHQHEDVVELKLLRYLSVLGKFLTTYLAPIELNEFGVPEGGKGFHNNIWANGRVRTRLSQLTQTGRYTSQAANLQTQPKKQEAVIFEAVIWSRFGIDTKEYKRRTFDGKPNKDKTGWEPGKEPYTGPDRIPEDQRPDAVSFKTCLVAKPGYSLVEVDFKNAEIFIWAYCSGDPDLIAIVDSGRDLHSEVACSAFQLPPLATMAAAIAALKAGNKAAYKQWNDEFKKEYESQRVGAKTVNFGIMYGRSAPALSREIQKTGIPSSAEECQAIIDSVAKQFPVAWKWLQKNKNFAVTHEYVETPFGRRRYFTGISQMSDMDKAAVKREASNSPIQGAVADLLAQAGIAFYRFRHGPLGHRVDFEILLPIHDAFLFECRDEHVEAFKKVITYCMSTMNKIPGTNYSLGVDITVMKTWGDH